MTIEVETLQALLHEGLCRDVKFVHRPGDGDLLLETYFQFPDGDRYVIHVIDSPTDEGGIRLSDRGETLMHISHECDLSFFMGGAPGHLLKRVMQEAGLKWSETGGEFCLDTTPEKLSEAVFQFGRGLTKVYDLTLLARFGPIAAPTVVA